MKGVERGDIGAIHRARVASRRMRELLPILQLARPRTAKLIRRLKKVTRRLGGVRELDVLLLLANELQESGRDATGAQRVADEVRHARDEAGQRLHNAAAAAQLRRVVRRLGEVAQELKDADTERPSRKWRWAAEARVARRATVLKHEVDRAGAVYLAERLHTVRIALKKLRYGVELVTEAIGAPGSADLKTLKRVQDLLGRMHDQQLLIDRVRQLQAALVPPDVTARQDLDSVVTSLERSCRRLHARYVRERAGIIAICQRIGHPSTPERQAVTRRAG